MHNFSDFYAVLNQKLREIAHVQFLRGSHSNTWIARAILDISPKKRDLAHSLAEMLGNAGQDEKRPPRVAERVLVNRNIRLSDQYASSR
jgi:hypothetical protein